MRDMSQNFITIFKKKKKKIELNINTGIYLEKK